MSTKYRIKTVVDFMLEKTGALNFGQWLTCLMEFDALILNEDRHLHNVAVIRKADGKYRLIPLFDNGAAFCSDTTKDYPLSMPVQACIRNVKAKPFNTNSKTQISACRELYGDQLKVGLTEKDITLGLLDGFSGYSQVIKVRILSIIRFQLKMWK